MINLFAHAGETHADSAEATFHFLQEWYIALPLLLLVTVGVATLAYFLARRSKPITYLVVVAFLLVTGVFTYSSSPVVSIVALSTGMAMTLLMVLVSLGHKR